MNKEIFFNIEIKAKCNKFDHIRQLLKENHAKYIGTDKQTDTYFNVDFERLKLREGNIENNLIYYQRKDDTGPKKSDVILYKSTDSNTLKQILVQSLGVLTEVVKKREIYFIDNVKIHLDTVDELGTFIEIEAIRSDEKDTAEKLKKQCDYYIELFNIRKEDLIAISYSDMMK